MKTQQSFHMAESLAVNRSNNLSKARQGGCLDQVYHDLGRQSETILGTRVYGDTHARYTQQITCNR